MSTMTEDCPEHCALKACYDKLVSGMVARDILPKFFARDFVTDYEKQDILADVVAMDANEKLLKAVLRQGGHVVVYLCRVLFEVKLKELGWRLYHGKNPPKLRFFSIVGLLLCSFTFPLFLSL